MGKYKLWLIVSETLTQNSTFLLICVCDNIIHLIEVLSVMEPIYIRVTEKQIEK